MKLVKSKQPDVIVKNTKPNFNYSFADDPVEVKDADAEVLCKNSNFEIVGEKEGYDSSLDLNKDGKIDKKDASIAGKVMAAHRRKK